MEIKIAQGHNPPHNIHGITVVIDVIRAFTTSHEAFLGGASHIYPVATAEDAFQLRETYRDGLLVGEIQALPIDGFDHGNSPWEIRHTDVRGRYLIMRTTNGVTATLRARDSQQVLVGALVNARATARYIRECNPETVVLVASHPTGDEDVACAEYLRGLLGGEGISLEQARDRTRNAFAAKKFLDGRHPRLRPQDIDMAASDGGEDALVMGVTFDPVPRIDVVRGQGGG
ncbi:MAG: 2-phosphosulfolactate phosphatase [Alcanivorax sp.]|nr:2-phosphosulfolactate phosphatase [Alcanivorax sp.]HCE40643.1 2-phosphosulfolactate phosphatase [Alcanivorax sp.]|tara:strand:+ start:3893 stop:4582 length:690 start_codon:yes stop_codon:yes gene_type:complete